MKEATANASQPPSNAFYSFKSFTSLDKLDVMGFQTHTIYSVVAQKTLCCVFMLIRHEKHTYCNVQTDETDFQLCCLRFFFALACIKAIYGLREGTNCKEQRKKNGKTLLANTQNRNSKNENTLVGLHKSDRRKRKFIKFDGLAHTKKLHTST